jgi:hypothetical protein
MDKRQRRGNKFHKRQDDETEQSWSVDKYPRPSITQLMVFLFCLIMLQ